MKFSLFLGLRSSIVFFVDKILDEKTTRYLSFVFSKRSL